MSGKFTWDDFSNGVNNVVNTVGDVACDVFDQSKKYVKKASLKRKLNDKFRELGEITQQELEIGKKETEKKKKLCAEIAELKAQIAKADAKEDEPAVATIVCPKCGKASPSNAVFCISCGAQL